MILRASYWTWKLLNGETIPDEMPTAYLMLDGKCMYDCAYCTHARSSTTDSSYLSRIVWKEIEIEKLLKSTGLFRRICIQTVNYKGYAEDILNIVGEIRKIDKNVLISVSTRVSGKEEIDTFLNNGIDQLGIAIDCVSAQLHKQYRGWTLEHVLSLIEYGAQKYPSRITTHIIVGLGESDIELFNTFKKMKSLNVEVALFAFTPIRGTKLQQANPPELERYRKIQILRYLIFNQDREPNVEFNKNGYISNISYDTQNIHMAFLTSGCTHCTRPYYNDKPNQEILYNYHTLPSEKAKK